MNGFTKYQGAWAAVGAAAAVAGVLGGSSDLPHVLPSYLSACVLWVSISLGSLGFLMIQRLSGGRWGVARPYFEAAAFTIPLAGLFFVPVLFHLPALYEWARPEVMAQDHLLQHKRPYLNPTFFTARTAGYFLIWTALAFLVTSGSPARTRRFSAAGLLIYVLTVSFAAFDWMMSLEPHWFSSGFGALFVVGTGLSAMAFCAIASAKSLEPDRLHDLGNLLFAFLLLWTYLSFAQYLLMWYGNLPEETPYYLRRSAHGWQYVGVGLIIFHFAVPFAMLLSRSVKRNPGPLRGVAIYLLAIHYMDVMWLVKPVFAEHGVGFHWMDFVAPLALGGFWLALYGRNLGKRLGSAST